MEMLLCLVLGDCAYSCFPQLSAHITWLNQDLWPVMQILSHLLNLAFRGVRRPHEQASSNKLHISSMHKDPSSIKLLSIKEVSTKQNFPPRQPWGSQEVLQIQSVGINSRVHQ